MDRSPARVAGATLALLLPALALPAAALAQPVDGPPSTPTGTVARAYGPTSGGVAWNRSTDDHGVRGYEVVRDGTVLGTFDALSYIDRDLDPGVAHRYGITAIDTAGQRSGTSVATLGGRAPGTAPPAPSGLRAERYSSTAAELFWARERSGPPLRYEVIRDGAVIGDSAGTSFFDDGIEPGTTPTYEVVAIDGDVRSSAASVALDAFGGGTDPAAPPAPEALRASVYSSTAGELFWARAATSGLAYEVRRDGAALGTTSGTSFFDDTLAGGRTYVYEVIAIGADGARSAPAGVTLDTPSGAPAGPAGPPAPAGLVTAESYEGLLREAVALINREFLESTLDEIDDLTSGFRTTEGDGFAGATFVSSDTGERFGGGTGRFDLYSCDAGGSVRALVEFGAAVSPDDVRFDDCRRVGGRYDGRYAFRSRGREGTSSALFEGFAVEADDGSSLLIQGRRERQADRIGVLRALAWTETAWSSRAADGATVRVTGYDSSGFARNGPERVVASATAAYTVTAPWTGDAPLAVEARLSLDEDAAARPDVVNWTEGEIVLEAGDGSSFRVDAGSGDPDTFLVYVNGSAEPIVRSWSEAGLQVRCELSGEACS